MTQTHRICLITPGHLATNPRIVKEADALAAAGYEVFVIAADYLEWASAADAEFDDRPWRLVRRIPFGPRAPKPAYVWQTLRRRAARGLIGRIGFQRGLVERAIHPIAPDLARAAEAVAADLYIAHYVAALPAAAQAASRHGAKLGFDAEDYHSGEYPDSPEYAFDRELTCAVERRYLPRCDHLTAASPGIAAAYADRYGIRSPTVVLNVFSRKNAPSAATPRGSARPGPSVYWFSQTVGPDRGLECAVRALGVAQSQPHFYLRGIPIAGYVGHLQHLAAASGATDRLHILPPAEPDQMERLASVYDVGLVAETGSTQSRSIALTNKLFTYVLAGIPMAMSDIPAHGMLRANLGAAARLFPVDDVGALAAALDHFLGDASVLAGARATAFNLGQQTYNWEKEQDVLLSTIQRTLSRPIQRDEKREMQLAARRV